MARQMKWQSSIGVSSRCQSSLQPQDSIQQVVCKIQQIEMGPHNGVVFGQICQLHVQQPDVRTGLILTALTISISHNHLKNVDVDIVSCIDFSLTQRSLNS
jgi:hypothetical protein